ncbi:MAG: hypothetical protein ABW208_17075, partial [Pyrinomonadaceae bacterium]
MTPKGCVCNAHAFRRYTVLTRPHASFAVLLGGSSQPHWAAATDAEIGNAVREELEALLGVRG